MKNPINLWILLSVTIIFLIIVLFPNQKIIYGIHTLSVLNDTAYIQQLDDLGVSMVREYLPWAQAEKQKGIYNYYIDDSINTILNRNINILFRLDPGNSLYNNCTQEMASVSIDKRFNCTAWYIPSNPDNFRSFLTAWGNFCYNTVLHYKGKIKYFEIHNEYNGEWKTLNPDIEAQYSQEVEILKECYTRGKQANPRAIFVSGGLGTDINTMKYIEGIYKYGGKNYFDILGVHPYCSYSPSLPIENQGYNCDTLKNLELVRSMMKMYNDGNKDIWITEAGYPTAGCYHYGQVNQYCPQNLSETNQAIRLKNYMESLSKYPYVKAVFWFTFRDRNNINPLDYEYHFGIINVNGTAKLAFNTYKQLISEAR